MQVTYGPEFGITKPETMREKVDRLESVLMASPMPDIECPIKHYFAHGLYAREMSIPAGTVVTGAIHKTESLIVVSMGRLQIVTADGTREVKAGDTFTCQAGMKNAVVALEDSRWTNFMSNPSNETDVDKLVEVFTHSKASELLGGVDNVQLLAQAELKKVRA